MSDHDEREYIHEALRPLVAQLRKRYPGVRIVWAHYGQLDDGTAQQILRYQAPLDVLRRVGLLTDDMLRRSQFDDSRLIGEGVTALGDSFMVCPKFDQASRPGCLDLSITTRATPDERPRISVKQAARLLRDLCRRLDGAS